MDPLSFLETPEDKNAFREMENQPFYEYNNVIDEFIGDIEKGEKILPNGIEKILVVKNILDFEQCKSIKDICKDFFTYNLLPKLSSVSRPLDKKYSNLIERQLGRFEIIPPNHIVESIWNILRKSYIFEVINQNIKTEIKKNNPLSEYCIEELGILPIEPHTKDGYWHRDVYFGENGCNDSDYQRNAFYITQVIYLDNISNTEFCINSRNNNNNNYTKYDKKIIHSDLGSCVVFDGRHLHRGLANSTEEIRYAIYISYYISSYVNRPYDFGEYLNLHLQSLYHS